MSGGGGVGGAARVSIPASWRKLVTNIKEIASSHSDDEIYAMLLECDMNPDETAQKLLHQDTFHEVRRKRDKRKEHNVREPADPRWSQGLQGRGSRGGRGNFSSRYGSADVMGTKNIGPGKENGAYQGSEKVSSSTTTPDTENKVSSSMSSSVPGMGNNPDITSKSQVSDNSDIGFRGENFAADATKICTTMFTSEAKSVSTSGKTVPISDHSLSTKRVPSVSGDCVSTADPVALPSVDTHNFDEVGTIKCTLGGIMPALEATTSEVASHDAESESSSVTGKRFLDVSSSCGHAKLQTKSQGLEAIQLSDTSHLAGSSLSSGPTSSRTSSNYSNRAQQLSVSQKAIPTKEWKPKLTQSNPQPCGVPDISEASVTVESIQLPDPCPETSEESTSNLEKRLDEVHISDRLHVIIPNHLQVPEYERHCLSFGSFDVGFKLNITLPNGPECDKSPTAPSESSEEVEENFDQPTLSVHAQETDHPSSPTPLPEDYLSKESDIPSISVSQEFEQAKQESVHAPDGPQFSVVQSTPSFSTFGLVPQILGTQFSPFESSESQAHDTTRVQSFVVQRPFDPSSSYYNQFYQPSAEADGRFSPFITPGGLAKYNGNMAVLPAQTGQVPLESGNSNVPSTDGSTPLATQAAGIVQSSIAIPQQPVPVFRQPAGVHISHYPPNYMPYSQYFSPFYVPPPTIHHFLGSAAFPQQTPGNVYPAAGAAAAAAASVKYSLSQYKPGTNSGNSTIVGMPTGYATYNSNSPGYSTNPAVSTSNSSSNEDINSSQFKENNFYMPGQQSEGSAVWVHAPGRDISTLQASSFYNIPPQGQHMTFAPTQAGHGAFSGVYHPTPTVAAAAVHPLLQQSQAVAGAVEMVAPPAGVYQQSQRTQVNWANNY